MKKKIFIVLLFALFAFLLSAQTVSSWYSSESYPGDTGWYTRSFNIDYTLDRQPDYEMEDVDNSSWSTIYVNPGVTYQTMEGIGTSLEESTVYNLARMTPEKRTEVLKNLVDPENGIGMNLIRICFGSSDFTGRQFYTYDDMPAGEKDPDFEYFSIQKDIDYNIIAVVKEALSYNPDIKIFASSWSPPGWMKSNDSIYGQIPGTGTWGQGTLLPEYYDEAAEYYRRALQAYRDQGIEIFALTVQNEPLFPAEYPGCLISAEGERELVKLMNNEFDSHGFDTKIWIFDHNFSEGMDYISPILNDTAAYNATDGIAFHDYSGEPWMMSEIHDIFPEKPIYLTERSVWGAAGAHRILEYFRNWACSYNSWVTMLDSNIAPEQWTGVPDPTMLVQEAWNVDTVRYTPEYYLTGQFSKFIQRGAKRIDSTYESSQAVSNVAFLNPDNNIVMVVVNQNSDWQPFKVICNSKQFIGWAPPNGVVTYRWQNNRTVNPEREITVKAAANGKYVCADDVGDSPLIANRDAASGWETFFLRDNGDGTVSLRAAANGKFVCADNGGNSPLIANRDAVGGWEKFYLINNSDGTVSLRAAANGKYVCAEDGGNSSLIANRDGAGGWEKFYFEYK